MGLVRDLAIKLLRVQRPVVVPPTSTETGKEKRTEDESYLPDSVRMENYKLFHHMERDPIIRPAINIYADEVIAGTSVSTTQPFVINTNSKAAARVIEIFQKTVTLQGDPYMDYSLDLCRDIAQYGDVVWEIVCDKKRVLKFNNLIPETMRYIKMRETWKYKDGSTEIKIANRYQQWQPEKDWVTFDSFQITHFKGVKSLSEHWAYSASILWPVQSVWQLLHYGVEAMSIDRIYASHHARLFLIDTGELRDTQAWEHVEKLKELYSREQRTDPDTGELLLWGGLPIPEEDLMVPHGAGNKTDVKELYGSRYRPIGDIEFTLLLLCVGLGVPPQRMGILKDVRTRAVMHTVYIQFAKNVNRIRVAVERGLSKAIDIQLMLAGLRPEQHSYWFSWPPISAELELRKLETMKIRAEVAEILTMKSGLYMTDEWIYQQVFGMTDEEVLELKKEKPKEYVPLAVQRRPRGGMAAPLKPEQWNALLQSEGFTESVHNLKWLLDHERSRTKHGEYKVD